MPRQIVILTLGTLGDVKPYVALGLALQQAGYKVRLAAPVNYLPWIAKQNLETARCGGDFRALMQDEQIVEFINSTTFGQILRHHRIGNGPFRPMKETSLKDTIDVTADADLILFHPMVEFACDVAEARGVPAILVAPTPLTATAEFPICLAPRKDYGPRFNKLTYSVLYLHRFAISPFANALRSERLGLRKLSRFVYPYRVNGRDVTALIGTSPSVLERPSDWADNVHLSGFWFYDTEEDHDWVIPPDLEQFINSGDPPIYIGFGSMPSKEAAQRTEMIIQACTVAGKRAILAQGWGGVSKGDANLPPDRFYILDHAPHSVLFPKMSAVVHHGGAGTTATGFRAGCPTLICPFAMDQPFWGWRAHALGVGPEPLPAARWSVQALATALKDVSENPVYRNNAQSLAAKIAQENGLKAAVDVVQMEFGPP